MMEGILVRSLVIFAANSATPYKKVSSPLNTCIVYLFLLKSILITKPSTQKDEHANRHQPRPGQKKLPRSALEITTTNLA